MGPDLDASVEHGFSQHAFRAEVVEDEERSGQSDRHEPCDHKAAHNL